MDQPFETALLEANSSQTKGLIKTLAEQSQCPVCQDLMFVPCMTRCGHNFCYNCLTEWLQTRCTCPTCRSEISEPPCLNRPVQTLVKSLVDTYKNIKEKLPNDLKKEMKEKLAAYAKDLEKDYLYKNKFKDVKKAILDPSDGVCRCGYCNWEVDGPICPNCEMHVILPPGYNVSNSGSQEYLDYLSEGELHDLGSAMFEPLTYRLYGLGNLSHDDDDEEEDEEDDEDNDFFLDGDYEDNGDYDDDADDDDDDDDDGISSHVLHRFPFYPSEDSDDLDFTSEYEDWDGIPDELDGVTPPDLNLRRAHIRLGQFARITDALQESISGNNRASRVHIIPSSDSNDSSVVEEDWSNIPVRRSQRIRRTILASDDENVESQNLPVINLDSSTIDHSSAETVHGLVAEPSRTGTNSTNTRIYLPIGLLDDSFSDTEEEDDDEF